MIEAAGWSACWGKADAVANALPPPLTKLGRAGHGAIARAAIKNCLSQLYDRASPARRRGHADAGIVEPCLGGLDVVPTETRRLVLGSDHNGGMSRHSDLMSARARLRWLGEVRQISAIGTKRRSIFSGAWSAFWGKADAIAQAHDLGRGPELTAKPCALQMHRGGHSCAHG